MSRTTQGVHTHGGHGWRRRAAALLGFEGAAFVTLVQLRTVEGFGFPHHDIGSWLAQASTDDVLAVSLRCTGLVTVGWLFVSTLLWCVAMLTNRASIVRIATVATPRPLRRWFERSVAATALCVAASVGAASVGASSAMADSSAASPPVVRQPAPTTTTARPEMPVTTSSASTPSVSSTSSTAAAVTVPPRLPIAVPETSPAPDPMATPVHHVVVRGDNLWSIASARLHTLAPSSVSDSAIARYWRVVVDRNRPTLRSGNPNVIYPGEVIELPPAS